MNSNHPITTTTHYRETEVYYNGKEFRTAHFGEHYIIPICLMFSEKC